MDRRTLIYYHIPGDSDDARHPNAFVIMKKPEDVRLKDVTSEFPLPGKYHFRFKFKIDNSDDVWMDITDEESAIPLINAKAVAKVLRVSWFNNKVIQDSAVTVDYSSPVAADSNGKFSASKPESLKNGISSENSLFNKVDKDLKGGDSSLGSKPSIFDSKSADEDILKMFDAAPVPPSVTSPKNVKNELDFIFT